MGFHLYGYYKLEHEYKIHSRGHKCACTEILDKY